MRSCTACISISLQAVACECLRAGTLLHRLADLWRCEKTNDLTHEFSPTSKNCLQPHPPLMLAAFTIGHHLAISAFWCAGTLLHRLADLWRCEKTNDLTHEFSPTSKNCLQPHPPLMLAAFTIGHHLAISAFWCGASASGVC